MKRKQLIALLICNFIIFFVGNALMGLFAIRAIELGANPSAIGLFLASAFLALTISNLSGGPLSNRLQRRKGLLIICGALAVPGTWLVGQASTLTELIIFTSLLWFNGGIIASMVSILAGLHVDEHQRGRVFGFMGGCVALGGLFGGLISGWVMDHWGFSALCTLLAATYIVVPIAASFIQDKPITAPKVGTTQSTWSSVLTNRTFAFLFLALILGYIANSAIILARPLQMNSLAFNATAISSTGAVGGLIALPLPILFGWLSDRLGRKPFIIFCCLINGLGLVILMFASELWHFWGTNIMQSMFGGALVVGSALVTDLFPKEKLATALSILGATPWIGFVFGFGLTGSAIQALTMTPTLLIGVFLAIVAVVLLISTPVRRAVVPAQGT